MKKIILISIIALFANAVKAQYSVLYNLDTASGIAPYSSLILSGTTLYGMSNIGGANNEGVIFSIQTNGAGYTVLHDFNGANGSSPVGSLILSGTTLYGMTPYGGANGHGVIFSIQTNGTGYNVLLDFNTTNAIGANPMGSLILSGTILYGMTESGGANSCSCGVIFSIQTNGTGYTDMLDFNGTNGKNPYGSLTLSGTTLYGMTYLGGANNDGVIFSIQTNGTSYTDMLDFGTWGTNTKGSLILSGTTLYGMTAAGGAGEGNIFSIQTNGTGYTDMFDFNLTNGSHPYGSLALSGTTLYGMTPYGGANNVGVLFSIQTNGTGHADMWDFNLTNGYGTPFGSLALSGTTLYGMTPYGGANGGGVIFKYDNIAGHDGISEINNQETLTISPNPFTSASTITFNTEQKNTTLYIRDVLGKEISKQTFSGKEFIIEKGDLNKGIYFVEIIDENKISINKKIIVQ